MDLLGGAAISWCVVYVLLAVSFGILARRRAETAPEYAVMAVVCVLGGAYAYCHARQYLARDESQTAEWGFRAFLCAPAATAAILHATVLYAELPERTRRRLIAAAWVVAALITIASLAGLLHDHAQIRPRSLALGPFAFVHRQYAPRPLQAVANAAILVGLGISATVLVRAWRSGKREALFGCVGAVVLAATAVNDVLVVRDVDRSIFLAEHGFSAFAFGLSYTLLARYERIADELSGKSAELRERARQIGKAYAELRSAQEELVQKEQLALVGELAAVVSHEVRNPLAIISNAVAGLRRPTLPEEDHATLLSILDEETARLNRLVGDLLRYARPLEVERAAIDLDALLARASELARDVAGVELVLDLAWSTGNAAPPVYGDPNLLRQVFDNLVQNACQAMPTGGVLTIRTCAATEDGAAGVRIAIGDTGEGMDTQVRSRVGTPFFTTRPGGTGLGLAICDRIVTTHGGVLGIESRAGEGTTVTVFLPANRASAAPALRETWPTPLPRGAIGAGRGER